MSAYSRYRNYFHFPILPDSSADDYEYHRKLIPILELLESSIYRCDYVVWTDADLIVLDFEFKFEDLIHKQPLAHVYLSKDVSTLSNTGCMVFRNTLWTKKFIRRWIENKSKPTCYNEQTGFDELYYSMVNSKEADSLSERVALLPIHVLNSEAPAMWKQQADHKILHLAAEDNAFRQQVFKRGLEELCTKKNIRDLSPQLGLNRKSLQLIAIDTYGSLAQSFENKISAVLSGSSNSFFFDINPRDLEAYRLQVSKYAYALAYYDREWRCETAAIKCDPIQSHYESAEIISKRIYGHEIFQDIIEQFLLLVLESTVDDGRYGDRLPSQTKAILQEKKIINERASKNPEEEKNTKRLRHRLFLKLFDGLRNSSQANEPSSITMNIFQELFRNPRLLMKMIEKSILKQDSLGSRRSQNHEILKKRMEFFYNELPEILKMSLEISYELLHILYVNPHFFTSPSLPTSSTRGDQEKPVTTDYNSADHRPDVLDGIVSYMKILFEVLSLLVAPSQLNIVIDMERDFQSFIQATGFDGAPPHHHHDHRETTAIIVEEL